MKKIASNDRGVLLVVASIVMAVIAVLTGVYLTSLVGEKRSFDTQRGQLQAFNLAESAAVFAFSELEKRAPSDLNTRVASANSTTLRSYVTGNQPLQFLADYAYAAGESQFTVSGSTASLSVTLPTTDMGFTGSAVATVSVTATQPPTKDSDDGPFRFYYQYQIAATAAATLYGQQVTKSVAFSPQNFTIIVRHDNFAKFALFTNHHKTSAGTTVWFTADTNFYGPVHTNDRFSFANSPSAHFTDEVSQHQNTARYYNNGSSIFLDDDHNGTRDVPVFDSTFSRSQDIINLPSSIGQTELRNQALGTMAMPGASSRGVYVPNSGGAVTGGIFIKGNSGQSSDNANIVMSKDASNNAVFTISQNLSGTLTTKQITVDRTANTTTVKSGTGSPPAYGSPTSYTGIPDGVGNEGIIIYADDDIKSFEGLVQKDTIITVSSERDIVISNNILYEEYGTSPRLNATGYTNMLGILSWGGNIRIGTGAPDNVQIHGIIMAHNGVFTVDDYDSGSPRGTATLLGGVISDYYGAFGTFSGSTPQSGYGRNFIYDSRVLDGETPPYFPYLTGYTSNVIPSDVFDTRPSFREEE